MPANMTAKELSGLDGAQALKGSFNDVNYTLTVDGFLTGLVGRRVDLAITTTTIADDTENYTFSENFGALVLYVYKVVYTDGTRATLLYAERTA
jgi:ABC-type amino acid transport substrate-binding protein